jgi:RNA polymerase sigma factor (sigma-70 family)
LAALNALRGRARRVAHTADVEVDGIASGDGASPERRAELRAVVRAVQGLPPRQRAALVLRQWEGLGYAEIAGVLGGNEAAARANVYQAIRRLRLVLGGPQ